jgi:vancomycin resistance protein YoaR
MNKHLSSRFDSWTLPALIAGIVIFLLLGIYGINRAMSAGEVMGRVEVAGTPIGGLDKDQALTALVAVDESYVARPAVFVVESKLVSMQPAEAGFNIDDNAIIDSAMELGRSGNPFGEFWWWLTHIFSTEEVPVQGDIDQEAVDAVFDTWDEEVIDNPAQAGGVVIEDGEPTPVYPEAGIGVDRSAAPPVVLSALLAEEAEQTEIPTSVIEPKLDDADIDSALDEARELLSGPIELVYDGSSVTFSTEQLINAFVSRTVIRPNRAFVINTFDPEIVSTYLDPTRAEFEAEPVDARFSIDGDTVSVIPGANGTRIDEVKTVRRLAVAGLIASRTGELPVVKGSEPDTTTKELVALNVHHLVSQFTTYFDCCQPRVTNIQTMAATVDGAIVMPGATFSLNDFVGERTEEKGYVAAPTIIAGEIEDTFGGGVSQFTTTMYNAVFWGGYDDIEHQPHSYYFDRYPEGIEATLNWTTPDLVFHNNRDHAILIDTYVTDTSITIRFYGDNDGRSLMGEQSGGETKIWVHSEGGPDALHVKGSVSDRFAVTEPGDPRYEANPELDPDDTVEIQTAADGWSVTVTRTIYAANEVDVIDEQTWTVRYAPKFAVFEVHPCKMPGSTKTCPTTTTTTTEPPTTSTTGGGGGTGPKGTKP